MGIDNTFSGSQAGYSNTTGNYNTFSGFYAGYANTIGFANTFSGYYAGVNNTTGFNNTFFGYGAGGYNTTGVQNTFSGSYAGFNTSGGNSNTFVGFDAGYSNTTASYNTFSGFRAGLSNSTGEANTFSGYQAGYNNTTGNNNDFYGINAGYSNTDGNSNTFLGVSAGYYHLTGDNNIYIRDVGFLNPNESNTIRIGSGVQTQAFMDGIYGATIASGTAVFINGSGQLGTFTSSRRFKEQIRDMGDSTSGLMKLRPVTFLYKPEYDKGPRTLQYGLIAEEVAEVYPDLVAYEPDGKPYTVKYQYLTTMLLNEVQKQYHRAETQEQNMKAQSEVIQTQQQNIQTQAEVMKTQQQEIDGLKAQLRLQNATFQERLSRLESIVGTQTRIAAELPHQ